ncbi:MAG: L,D-transpeptidase [Candidatus Sericytochromatia bacterium]|nr:L,D-transpeptidase [Candidatus Sericytochromatia bacterium]
MKRFPASLLTLALLISTLIPASAAAQTALPDPLPTPPAGDIGPDVFPSLSPLPPKPPVDEPEPEASPTPLVPRRSAEPVPVEAGQLTFTFPEKLIEGQRFSLVLEAQGRGLRFPVKGQIVYLDGSYDLSQTREEKIAFELSGSGQHTVPLTFRSAGRKTLRIIPEQTGLPTRNAAVFVQPFPATVFPNTLDSQSLSADPADWKVWVNIYHNARSQPPQQQYYLVTHKGQIVQKLLTSSATPGKVTPQGTFKLGPKAASPRSTLYESVMPFWTTILIPGFSFEYGNHGLVGEGYLYSLGSPASHGCLRLSNKWVQQNGEWLNIGGAKWVYTHVPVGTTIHIFSRPAPVFAAETYRMWLSRRR